MKTEQKKINTDKIESIFKSEAFQLVDYSLSIINLFENGEIKSEDEGEEEEFYSDSFFKSSIIYNKIANRELTEKGFLELFAIYFDHYYSKMAYYTSVEKYEVASVLQKAVNYEVEFTLKFILHNFNIRYEVELLQKKFKDFYLNF